MRDIRIDTSVELNYPLGDFRYRRLGDSWSLQARQLQDAMSMQAAPTAKPHHWEARESLGGVVEKRAANAALDCPLVRKYAEKLIGDIANTLLEHQEQVMQQATTIPWISLTRLSGLAFALLLACQTAFGQYEQFITPNNPWEAENLFVIIKDVNSTFITANQNYIDSLTPFFPTITKPEDVRDKTDYDFYPKEDADKYRADDASVIEAGVGYETIEANQVTGGERTFVYVRKEPLFDKDDNVVGLLVKFYDIPEPDQTSIPQPRNTYEANNVVITDKNTEGTYLNANHLFISRFQLEFSYLKSVTNLIGRNDFCFYSEEEAESIIQADVLVAISGRPLKTIEFEYIPGGPEGVYYHVLRQPLRDATRQVIGVRTTIWPLKGRKSKRGRGPK